MTERCTPKSSVLLLGATGFIGSRTLAALLDAGYDVTCGVRDRGTFSRCRGVSADQHAVSRYHRSKKQADDRLAALSIPWVIVQPSLVFGQGGASAALFNRLAALPVVPVPGDGKQNIQPIHVDDLAAAIVRVLETANTTVKGSPRSVRVR
ncbi:MAG: NAD-dependent epimerase/dehydratase family protein [Casimicrobiaceae bacterium]